MSNEFSLGRAPDQLATNKVMQRPAAAAEKPATGGVHTRISSEPPLPSLDPGQHEPEQLATPNMMPEAATANRAPDPVVTTFLRPRSTDYNAKLDASCEPGVYMLAMDQGTLHGNYLSGPDDRTPCVPVLTQQAATGGFKVTMDDAKVARDAIVEAFQAYGAFIAPVADASARGRMIELFRQDLADLAPLGLALGMPNCQKCGLFSGQGLTHGRFPAAMKLLPNVSLVVRRICAALGALDPWGDLASPQSQSLKAAPCHSFDALAITTTAHRYKKLEEHVDSNTIEPGLRQYLIFLHPPPTKKEIGRIFGYPKPVSDGLQDVDYLRLGVFCAWYSKASNPST